MDPAREPVLAALREALASRASRALQAVWLFGSRARGNERPDSDLDVGLLCEPPLALERTAVADHAARALGVDVDVIDMASCDPILAWEIVTSGRILLEADERAVERFVRHARFRAEDADQRNRMILLAAEKHP